MRVGVSFNRQSSPLGSPQPLMSPGATNNDVVITYLIIFDISVFFLQKCIQFQHFTAETTDFTTSTI